MDRTPFLLGLIFGERKSAEGIPLVAKDEVIDESMGIVDAFFIEETDKVLVRFEGPD